MKALILFIAFLSVNFTEPVMSFHGVYFRQGNKAYVNLGWWTTYSSNVTYYNTIRKNGVIVAQNYYDQYNRISIPVPTKFTSATYSITQTVNGVESAQTFTTVTK